MIEEEEEDVVQSKLAIAPLVHRQVDQKEDDQELLQAKEVPGQAPEVTPDVQAQINDMRGRGQPLPKSACDFFEPRFGHDFGEVRVHADRRSAEVARLVNARGLHRRSGRGVRRGKVWTG